MGPNDEEESCVTWQIIDYSIPEDDTILSKHVGGENFEIFLHLLVVVQNNKGCTVHVSKQMSRAFLRPDKFIKNQSARRLHTLYF